MKTTVLVILSIGLLFVLAGCINGNANSSTVPNKTSLPDTSLSNAAVQKVSLRAQNTGFYDKSTIQVKAGIPVEFSFSADKDSGCGRQLLIPTFGVNCCVTPLMSPPLFVWF